MRAHPPRPSSRCPLAVERLVGRVRLGPGPRQRGGHDVHHVHWLLHDTRFELGRPVEECRHADAPIVQTALAAAELAVACRQALRATPAAARSCGECAPLATTALRGPPLSLLKTISVFSRRPRFSRAATILPTWSSSDVIIAAYVRRVGSLMVDA